MALIPAVVAPRLIGAVRLDMGAPQAIEAEPHQLRGHRSSPPRRRATSPTTATLDLEEPVFVWGLQHPCRVEGRGAPIEGRRSLVHLGATRHNHEPLRAAVAPSAA